MRKLAPHSVCVLAITLALVFAVVAMPSGQVVGGTLGRLSPPPRLLPIWPVAPEDVPPVPGATGPLALITFAGDLGDELYGGLAGLYLLRGSEFSTTLDPTHNELRFLSFPSRLFLSFEAPVGFSLTPGIYEGAGGFPFQPEEIPGLDVSINSRGCGDITGRFLVQEAVFGPGHTVERFSARFEQHCGGWSAPLRGQIWIDAFGAMPTVPVAEFPPSPSTPTSFYSYQSDPGDWVGQGQSGFYELGQHILNAWERPAPNGPAVNIQMRHSTNFIDRWSLDFQSSSGSRLMPGTYDSATRWPFQSPGVPGLSVFGQGRGCNTLTGRFEVYEVVYGPQGEVLRFHAAFEQHCEGAVPALRGEIRIVADPWR